MAKTYQDLISEARAKLQDTFEETYRWSDDYMVDVLNQGLQELGRIRPDAFYDLYDANALNVPEIVASSTAGTGQTAWDTNFGIEMQFFTPLLAYIVGSIELTEDEFTVDGRAAVLLSGFRNSVLSI